MAERSTERGRRASVRRMIAAMAAVWLGMPAVLALAGDGDVKEKGQGSGAEVAAAGRRLEDELKGRVRPIVERYCLKCHSSAEPEGDVDLQRFTSLAESRRGAASWRKVTEILDKGEMPPPEARQPKADDRRALRDWAGRFLDLEARLTAGDPGRVVMRRLSNVEYTRTVRDLTRVPLDPAREFPQDGAAGEGFTNTGDALMMSPALLGKYLDAAKDIAGHAVLLPDGFRFSPRASRRDWTDELIAGVRGLYDRFADHDGKIPLDRYLAATIELRQHSASRRLAEKDIHATAERLGLSPQYLATLWTTLGETEARGSETGPLSDIRARWKTAGPGDVPALAGAIREWQGTLWQFKSTAIAFDGAWQVPVERLPGAVTLQHRFPDELPGGEVVLRLSAGSAGDGSSGDVVVWNRPRLDRPGRAPLLLRDVRGLSQYLTGRRREVLAATTRYLAAAAEAPAGCDRATIDRLATKHKLPADALASWLDYLGLAGTGPTRIQDYLAEKSPSGGGYDFIKTWRTGELPALIANASSREVNIPGRVKPHGIVVHPSPSRAVAIGWRSPIAGKVRVAPTVADAHGGCGNGVSWSLEWRRGGHRRRLAAGAFGDGQRATIAPIEDLTVQPGDLIALAIGPRDGNHGCDTTEFNLEIVPREAAASAWRLAPDVSGDLLAGNPHADRQGHPGVWHFYSEPAADQGYLPVVPAGSTLARWLSADRPDEKKKLAEEVARLLDAATPPAGKGKTDPDVLLHRQARSLDGPLFGSMAAGWDRRTVSSPSGAEEWGLDPALFGKAAGGEAVNAEAMAVSAPSLLEVRIPAELAAGRTFIVSGSLASRAGAEGSVQLELTDKSVDRNSLGRLRPGVSVVVRPSSKAAARWSAGMDEFRRVFPAALCFRQIIPVDEVVTVIQFFRWDEPFARLMLDDAGRKRLDRLWDELHYVSQDGIKVYQTFDQMLGFASQEGQTARVEAWRKPITASYEAAAKVQAASEPRHLDALIAFAARAYRRPLSDREKADLRTLYRRLRAEEELGHEDAFRLVLARVLVSPEFLYRVERPGPGSEAMPVNDWELASRLSYFLWATMPDEELTRLAAAGKLRNPDVLAAQTRRMVRDERARGLATEFACQWLEIRDFDTHDEKSERHFPTFAQVRPELYEEAVRFFADLFARDGSILDLIDADYTFLNENLAKHYGISGVTGAAWRRVEGVRAHGRGGVLALGAVLAKQSGASRTSPVLRGNWLLETLLGERLPKPPKNVPQLPDDEAATDGLTVRQLVEKHRSVASCAACHNRIDPFGFALEAYDPIGRFRQKDLGDRPVDTRAELKDGTRFEGLDGLKRYLMDRRKQEFRRQFCRKLLGYALGRAVQLSDEPLIDEMLAKMAADGDRVSAALETIVRSKPFRTHRGRAGDEARK